MKYLDVNIIIIRILDQYSYTLLVARFLSVDVFQCLYVGASDCSFTSSSITGRGLGVPRLNKRPIRQETTAGRVLATHGAKKVSA